MRQRRESAAAEAALAGLLAIALALGWRLAFQSRDLRAALRSPAPTPQLVGKGNRLAFGGLDSRGHLMTGAPSGTKRIVAFAMTGVGLRAQVAFWRAVRARGQPSTFLVGVCVDDACSSLAPRLHSSFPILVSGEVAGLSATLQAKRVGAFLVADEDGHIAAARKLSGLSPKALLAGFEAPR